MKAAVLQGTGTLAIEEVEPPRAEPGELVLAVRDCGICGSDLHAVHTMPPGTIFGHEFCGEVVAVGDGVAGWDVGDRAVTLPFFSCERCDRCRRGDGMFCKEIRGIGLGAVQGAYAERVRVQPENSLKIPETVGFRDAALVEPLAVGLHGIRRSRLERGGTCIILGAGPIGIATLLWARELGARAIVSDPSPGRRAMAERLGATAVVDPTTQDPGSVAESIAGEDVAAVFECVGVKGLIQSAMLMAPLRARVVVLGVCMATDEIFPIHGILKEIEIDFVLGYTKSEFRETLDAVASGRFDPRPMITDVIDLDAVPAMFAALATPNTQCKVLIEL
jgi:(R,R)-butanediol dehydrogenase / meso-butanediol dehydrogenase / diacetyl reductase